MSYFIDIIRYVPRSEKPDPIEARVVCNLSENV